MITVTIGETKLRITGTIGDEEAGLIAAVTVSTAVSSVALTLQDTYGGAEGTEETTGLTLANLPLPGEARDLVLAHYARVAKDFPEWVAVVVRSHD